MVKLRGEPSNLTGGGGSRRRRRGRTLGWPMYKPLGTRSERPWTPSTPSFTTKTSKLAKVTCKLRGPSAVKKTQNSGKLVAN